MERTVDEFFAQLTQSKNEVVYQEWLESERGWGVRYDGYSLHLSLGDLNRFVQVYWDSMPDEVPDEYSRPEGSPQVKTVEHSLYRNLLEARERGEYGLRFYSGRL